MRTLRETGWYCDGTVSGRRVKLVRDQRIELDGVVIPWPGANVDCLVMNRNGWLAGSVQRGDRDYAVVFNGALWIDLGPCSGRNPCAFDPQGSRLCVYRDGWVSRYTLPDLGRDDFPLDTGSQGIRYITPDGRIVTGDETYNEPSRTIFEFTDLGGFRIGHGNDRVGCLVQGPDGVYRILVYRNGKGELVEERGEVKFVLPHHEGDRFCIPFHREDTNESVWYWATATELLALPALTTIPEPGPTPDPNPEVPPMSMIDTIRAVRAKYPTPLGHDGAGMVCNEVCAIHAADGWGMVYKPSGTNWRERSTDVILNRVTGIAVDILGSSETDGIPTFNALSPADTPSLDRWRAPYPINAPGPVDPPVDPPDPGDNWESKFNALARRVLAVEDYLRSMRPFGG